jgi:16S rRNA (adenine1518-N6/adenine1519-N6)-dimethyltransferase
VGSALGHGDHLQVTHSALASPSATIAVLQRHGLYTKKSLGQHFLVDDNVVGKIIALAALSRDDVVLEVGPGIGTLTVALCGDAGAVVAVERDAALFPALAEATAGCDRIAVVQADAVTVPVGKLAEPFGPPGALVANLPYGVAATVVLRLFQEMPSVAQATVMVQAEVAARMSASPGGKEYGSYTVKLGLLAEAAGSFPVSRNSFMPPPRVDSTVLRLERRTVAQATVPKAGTPEYAATCRVADAAFAQRRKTLRNSLSAVLGMRAADLDEALVSAGVDGSCRAETLAPEAFVRMARELAARGLLGSEVTER